MAKVSAVEIRVGNLLEWDKRVWRVLKCYHVHVGGRGGAFMQVEMKDIESGTKTNQRFRTEDKATYEELRPSAEFLEGQSGYLLPSADVQVNFYNGRAIGLELPASVVL